MGNCGSKPPVEKDETDQPFPKGASDTQTPKENIKSAKENPHAVPISADEDITVEPVLTISSQPQLPPLGLTINTAINSEGSRPGTPRSTVAGTPRVAPIACTPRGMLPTSPRMSITSGSHDPNAPSFVVVPTVARAKAVSTMTVLPTTSLARQNSDSSESFEALMPVFDDASDGAAEHTQVAKVDTPLVVDNVATATSTTAHDVDNAMDGGEGEATAVVHSDACVTAQQVEDAEEDEVDEEDVDEDVEEDEDASVEEEDVAYINGDDEEEDVVEVNEEEKVLGDDVDAYGAVHAGRALTAEHRNSATNATNAHADDMPVHDAELDATYLPTAEGAVLCKPIIGYLHSSDTHPYADDDDVDEQSPLAVAIPPASPLSVLDCVILSPEEQARLTLQVMEEARHGDGVMLQRTVSGGVVSLEARAIPSPRNAFLNGQHSGDLVEVECVRAARLQAQRQQQYHQHQYQAQLQLQPQQQYQQQYQQDSVGLCGVREEEEEDDAYDCTTTIVAPRAPSILAPDTFSAEPCALTDTAAPTDTCASTHTPAPTATPVPADTAVPADIPALAPPSQPVLIAEGLWEAPCDGYVEDFVFVSVRVDVCGAAGAVITLYEDEGFDTVVEEVEDEEYELEEDEDVEYEYEEDEDAEVEEEAGWASAADEAMAMAVAATASVQQDIHTVTEPDTADVPAAAVAGDARANDDGDADADAARGVAAADVVAVAVVVGGDGEVFVRVCAGEADTSNATADADANTAAVTVVDADADDVDADGDASALMAALAQAIIRTAFLTSRNAKNAGNVDVDALAAAATGSVDDISAWMELADEKGEEEELLPEVDVLVEADPVSLDIFVKPDGTPLLTISSCNVTDDNAAVYPTEAAVCPTEAVGVASDAVVATAEIDVAVGALDGCVADTSVNAGVANDVDVAAFDEKAEAGEDAATIAAEEEAKTEEQDTSADAEPTATADDAAVSVSPAHAPTVAGAALPVLGVDTDGMDAAEAALLTRLRSQRRRSSLQMMLEAEEAYNREQEEKTRARMRELNEQLAVSPRSVRSHEILAFSPPTIASPRVGAVTPRADATPIMEAQTPPSRDECNFPSLGRGTQGEGEEVDTKDKPKKGGKKTKFIKLR